MLIETMFILGTGVYQNGDILNFDHFVKKMVTFVKIMVTFVKIMVTFIKIMVTFVKKMVTFKMSPFWYTLVIFSSNESALLTHFFAFNMMNDCWCFEHFVFMNSTTIDQNTIGN